MENKVIADPKDYQKLIKKYTGAEGIIKKKVEYLEKHYNKFPFNAKTQTKFLDEIKDSITFINTEYKEKEEKKEEEEEETPQEDEKPFIKYNPKLKKFVVDVQATTDYIIDLEDFKTIYGNKSETIYCYDGRCWSSKGKALIKTTAEHILENFANNHIVNEIVEKIKRKTETPIEEFEQTDINLIPFENGVYNIEKKKLIEHEPEYNFKFIIPVKYNPKEKCDFFLKFLDEILYPEDIKIIQELFGFALFREYFIKKGFIFVGEGDTGKTTLLECLNYFIGDKNKTGIPLQKITSGSEFTKIFLKNKHLNSYDDLSSKDLTDGGGFKIATGGGNISGEEKFGDLFQFRSFAKQVFATNKIPPVKDNDDRAYFNRWIPIQFDNVIEKKDNFIKTKLNNPKEMQGVLNWALVGLHRLLDKGKFSDDKTPEQIKVIMERSGNPLVAFVNDILIEETGSKITKEEMYQIYTKYAKDNNKPRLSKTQLGRQLEKNCGYIISKIGTKSEGRFWENVKPLESFWKLQRITTLSTLLKKPYSYKNKKNNSVIPMNTRLKIKRRKRSIKKDNKKPDNDNFSEFKKGVNKL